jgi:hypothetical protein
VECDVTCTVGALWVGLKKITYGLRVFESRVLRKIFGHKREEVRGDLRKLRSDEPQQMLRTYWADEMDGASVTYGERNGVYRVLVGK